MYPYPPRDTHDDERTEIDVRGIRPDRQPPVGTVFDEPTSEVPVIRPTGGGDPAAGLGYDGGPDGPDGSADPEPTTMLIASGEDPDPTTVLITSGGPVSDLTQPDSPTGSTLSTAVTEPPVDEPTTDDSDNDSADGSANDSANGDLATDQLDHETETAVQDPDTVDATDPVAASPASAPPITAPFTAPLATGAPAAVPDEPAPTGSRAPGEVAEESIAIWSDGATDQLREQWRELQIRFVDDPAAAVDGAQELVTEAVRQLADTLLEAQAGLDPFRDGEPVDTEAMRLAMRRYREFLDRVLAL